MRRNRRLLFLALSVCALPIPNLAFTAGVGGTPSALDSVILDKESGHPQTAIATLEKILKENPNDPSLVRSLAWLYFLSSDCSRAFTLTPALNPQDSSLGRYIAAACYKDAGRDDLAIPMMLSFIQQEPLFMPAYLDLAAMYEKRQAWNNALRIYASAVKSDPFFTEARVGSARIHLALGATDAALTQLTAIRRVDPDHPLVLAHNQELDELSLAKRTQSARSFTDQTSLLTETFPYPLATDRDALPRIRIGLGASPSGKPQPVASLMFASAGPIKIMQGARREPLLISAPASTWSISYASKPAKGMFLSSGPVSLPLRINMPLTIEPLSSTNTIIIHSIPFGLGFSWSGAKDRHYRERLEFTAEKNLGLIVVNDINLSEYLYSVLPSEMPPYAPLEALKAQAVIARTSALYRKINETPHRSHPYDLCDNQHCQVYSGVNSEKSRPRQAVEATRSLVLTYKGKLINALFHANCGGMTQTAQEYAGWYGAPYLQGISDSDGTGPVSAWELDDWLKGAPPVYCAASRYVRPQSHRWIWAIDKNDLQERLDKKYALGSLLDIRLLPRSSTGYVLGIRFIGSRRSIVVNKEHELKRLLSIGQLRSVLFSLDIKRAPDATIDKIYLFGAGGGHGVGLCQGGAANLADKGWVFKNILTHYYPAAALSTLKN
ncbi:MAG: SpoIID/LytB domain-containing protein [Elusimicrobiota bacterium]